MEKSGFLKLYTAFSRDQPDKMLVAEFIIFRFKFHSNFFADMFNTGLANKVLFFAI